MSRHERFDEALALHRRVPVVDGHADSILGVVADPHGPGFARTTARSLAERSDEGHLDFPRALEGGLSCTVQTAWPAPSYYPVAASRVLTMLDAILGEVERSPDARLATTAADVRACHAEGKLGVILNVEGAEPLHGQIGALRALYRLGVRILQPVWNHRNEAADGALEDEDGGLSNFGRALVREMNRLGMAVDGSHLGPRGLAETIDLSEDPILFTHGNCRALFDHRRNLTDDQIRALAARGGVFGISVVHGFMTDRRECPLSLMADHVDHAVQLVGPQHVAYGSDFDGTRGVPTGLESVAELPSLTAELLSRGYREEDLTAILGGNFLRVFEQVVG
jgi:membrane dipeptidase